MSNPSTAGKIDYDAQATVLINRLRKRDTDPAYADAPVLDTYARISRIYDAGDEEKTDRQTVDCLAKIERDGARLGEVLVDPNRSAWKVNGKRPAWARLLERIQSGQSHGVVPWHTDRLMRQPWDLEQLIRLAQAGYRISSCYGEFDFGNAGDLLVLRVLVAAASNESADKSRRLRAKNEARRRAGDARGGPSAFGHRNPEDDISDEQLTAERDAIAWGAAAIIDGHSLGYVANEWNARGLSGRRTKTWNPINVRQCLGLARHAGFIEYTPDAKRVPAQIVGRIADADPIIGEDTFRALRAVFEGRKRGGKAPGTGEHWLSTVLRCSRCGTAMVGATERSLRPYPDGSPRRVYRCTPRGCRSVSIDARAAEAWARHHTLVILSAPAHATSIARRSDALVQVETAIATHEEILRKALLRVTERPGTWERYTQLEDALTAKLDALQAERDALLAAGAGLQATALDAARLSVDWDSATGPQRRRLVLAAMPLGAIVAPAPKGVRMRAERAMERISLAA